MENSSNQPPSENMREGDASRGRKLRACAQGMTEAKSKKPACIGNEFTQHMLSRRRALTMTKIAAALTATGLACALAVIGVTPGLAQSTNPLQQPSTSQQPARASQPAARVTQPAPKAEAKTDAADEKPKRRRSEAQLANDNRLRRCGQEWRTNKDKLTGQGYNWIKFSTECRARLKAAGQ
jgi:hypothetical protein